MENINIKITSIEDNKKVIEDYINNDGYPGKFCGFKSLHKHYTHKTAGCTDWTGHPTSGKTYFVLELLFLLSERYGDVNALYVPDLGSQVDIIGKLIRMYTGKSINPKFGNKASMKDVFNSIPFLAKHFIILERKDVKEKITPTDLWEYVCFYKHEDGTVINNLLIDSWKNLYHDFGTKREDQYLDYILSYRNELAEKYNKHFHTIVHPPKLELEDEKDENGKRKRRVPTAYDLKGGGSWFDNGKNIITVDRPNKQNRKVDLYVWKTKPEDVGSQGAVLDTIELDLDRGRYYERIDEGFEINYPWKYIKFSRISNPNFKQEEKEPELNFDKKDDEPF